MSWFRGPRSRDRVVRHDGSPSYETLKQECNMWKHEARQWSNAVARLARRAGLSQPKEDESKPLKTVRMERKCLAQWMENTIRAGYTATARSKK